jgi:hypothetical protein
MGCHCATCRPATPIYGREAGMTDIPKPFMTREGYEWWIMDNRRRAQRERVWRRIRMGLIITVVLAAIVGLMLWAEYATAATMNDATTTPGMRKGLTEPDAAPHRGLTIEDAKHACEVHGGHWLQESEEDGRFQVIGCLFMVPKDAK